MGKDGEKIQEILRKELIRLAAYISAAMMNTSAPEK